jgi:ferredoxin
MPWTSIHRDRGGDHPFGILLEAAKMSSHTEFTDMVEEYSFIYDEEELLALESYWVAEYGTVSPTLKRALWKRCCKWAMRRTTCIAPIAIPPTSRPLWDTPRPRPSARWPWPWIVSTGSTILYYLHILACFIGLAYLPFSKMFHMFSSSFSLLANAVMDPETSLPANIATRQALELDACTHCGTCSLRCSVAVAYEANGNPMVLPGEKVGFLKAYAAGGPCPRKPCAPFGRGFISAPTATAARWSARGINLKELWLSVREPIAAAEDGGPVLLPLSPFSLFRGLNRHRLPADRYERPVPITPWRPWQRPFPWYRKPNP